jgi:hypothetical protein
LGKKKGLAEGEISQAHEPYEEQGAVHHLAAAVLCFPSSWLVSDKVGSPL